MPTPSVRPALPARAPYAPAPSGTPRAALPDRTGIRIDQPPAAVDGTVRRALPTRLPARPAARQPARLVARRSTPRD